MQVLLQFNGKKKNFVYRNPRLSVPELRWGSPGDVIECDSKDAELLTVGGDFKIVGSPEPIPEVIPDVLTAERELFSTMQKMVDEPIKRRPGRPVKVHNEVSDSGSDS